MVFFGLCFFCRVANGIWTRFPYFPGTYSPPKIFPGSATVSVGTRKLLQSRNTLFRERSATELLWPESNKRRPRITIAASMRGIQSDSTRPKAHNRNKNFGEQYWNAIRIVNWVNIRSCTSINKNSSRLDLGFCNVFVTILKMKVGEAEIQWGTPFIKLQIIGKLRFTQFCT